MSYSNPIYTTHFITGQDFTSTAAEDVITAGPKGLTGRVVGMSVLVTTGITVAASKLQVGISGGDLDAYAYATAAIAAADAVTGNVIVDGASGNKIPADTKFAIGNAGGSTAGVGEGLVVIAWS